MSIDLGQLLAEGKDLVDGALDTSGTTVRIDADATGSDTDGVVDRDDPDLGYTEPADDVLYAEEPAIIVPIGTIPAVRGGPNADVDDNRSRILLRSECVLVDKGHTVTVLTSNDDRAIGSQFKVTSVAEGTPGGVVRIVIAEPA